MPADRKRVQIDPGMVSVDFHEARTQANGETEKVSSLVQAW